MAININKSKDIWFKPTRGSYLPASWQGAVAYLLMLAYCIFVLVYAFNRLDSVAEISLIVVPNFVAAAVFMHWLAAQKS
jgi:hypothetical protein